METRNTLLGSIDGAVSLRLAWNTLLSPQPAAAGGSVQATKEQDHEQRRPSGVIATPLCHNMTECPLATKVRARLNHILHLTDGDIPSESVQEDDTSLSIYLSYGLAYTVGSALESVPPPSEETCLGTFLVPNKAGLTAGARAWSKHAHRSGNTTSSAIEQSLRWWGTPSGPVVRINERAVELFWKVWNGATWRNLHWLPHQILVYEVRVFEGYGMRWAQDHGRIHDTSSVGNSIGDQERIMDSSTDISRESNADPSKEEVSWVFRGFVEPMMENGHELGWKH